MKFVYMVLFVSGLIAWNTEVEEQDRLAVTYGAETEYVLWDGSRVDMLTNEYAIEVDWAPKWKEGIGQALYYGLLTDKKPGVLLLIKDWKAEMKYIYRCQTVCEVYGIKLFLEEVTDD